MRAKVLIVGLMAASAASLAGCQPKNNTAEDSMFEWASPHKAGRYGGLGVYQAGSQWSKVAVAAQPKDAAAAKTTDDEHVIVVVDSKTGEIRQCGDLSGYCIGMNPWAKPLGSGQAAPVPLTEHVSSAEPSSVLSAPPATPKHHHHAASSAEAAPAVQ